MADVLPVDHDFARARLAVLADDAADERFAAGHIDVDLSALVAAGKYAVARGDLAHSSPPASSGSSEGARR